MTLQTIRGICTAAFAPLGPDGRIDPEMIDRFVEFQIDSGVHALLVNGSTGEFAVLDIDRQKAIITHYCRAAAGRVPVIVHVGSSRLDEALELTRHARDLSPDGLAAVPPYFFAYDREALLDYFRTLAEAAPDIPFYLYNFPAAARNDLPPDLVARIRASCPNVLGVKDTSQDYARFVDYVDVLGPDFCTLMGSDGMLLAALVIGGHGAVSAAAACFPELMVSIYNSFIDHRFEQARRLQLLASRLRSVFNRAPYQPRRKMALKFRGLDCSAAARPMRPMTPGEIDEFRVELEKLEEEFEYPLLKQISEP